MSHAVRSMTAWRLRCPRVLPKASGAGAVHEPVASIGFVMPLIVRSRLPTAVRSWRRSSSVDSKVTSGWLAASKNSALRTWARNCSGVRIEIDSACAGPPRHPPVRAAVPVAPEPPPGQRRLHAVERAAEDGDALVADGEAEARMDRIGGVGAG